MIKSRGFSLLEVALAVSVGLMLMAGGVYAYRQHMHSVRITQAKMMLTTLRQGIEMYRYRTGAFPTAQVLRDNRDDRGQGFYGPAGAPLRDPLFPPMTAGDSSRIYDLSVPEATASWGGWTYHPLLGRLEPNLEPAAFPGDPPNAW